MEKILNKMYMEWEYIPTMIKYRWIIPINKPGKKGDKANDMRPISLTSYIIKIMEKVLCYRMVNYMITLGLLSKAHFGYLRGRNTQDCVTYLVDKIMRNYNNKMETHTIFYDFSAAFDCVRINILIWKLENEYFIHGKFIIFIENYLNGRYSAVIFEGFLSI